MTWVRHYRSIYSFLQLTAVPSSSLNYQLCIDNQMPALDKEEVHWKHETLASITLGFRQHERMRKEKMPRTVWLTSVIARQVVQMIPFYLRWSMISGEERGRPISWCKLYRLGTTARLQLPLSISISRSTRQSLLSRIGLFMFFSIWFFPFPKWYMNANGIHNAVAIRNR